MKEKIRPEKRYMLENGDWIAGLPFGYKKIDRLKRKYVTEGTVIIEEDKAEIINSLFCVYAQGICALNTIISYIYKKHGLKLQRSQASRILKNHFYYGIMRHKGEEFPHRYGQIITKSLFDKAQLSRQRNTRYGLFKQEITNEDILDTYKNKNIVQKITSIEHLMIEQKMSEEDAYNYIVEQELMGNVKDLNNGTWEIITRKKL